MPRATSLCSRAVTCVAVALLALCCLPDRALVSASCLKYGHSCWGAHGKRSNGAASGARPDEAAVWNVFELLSNMRGADLNALRQPRRPLVGDEEPRENNMRFSDRYAAEAESVGAGPGRPDEPFLLDDVEPRNKVRLVRMMKEAAEDK